MEERLLKEIEELRAENEILRSSFEEVRKETKTKESSSVETLIQDIAAKLNAGLEQAKDQMKDPAAKATYTIETQMKENPLPMILAAFGLGYILSRLLDRR